MVGPTTINIGAAQGRNNVSAYAEDDPPPPWTVEKGTPMALSRCRYGWGGIPACQSRIGIGTSHKSAYC
jgi:hypothetical protein